MNPQSITLIIRAAIAAGILTAIIYLIADIYTSIRKAKQAVTKVRRKLNVLKALELYWESNIENFNDTISVNEFIEINNLCDNPSKNEADFKKKLKDSKISYCYVYYDYISKTKYAKNKVEEVSNDLFIKIKNEHYD